jgi:SRSO17 transposase
MQRLLRYADWDVGGVRDDVRAYVIEHLGEPDRLLIADDTGFQGLMLSEGAAALLRYGGMDGELPGRHVPRYASSRGHALVDRELHLPQSWTDDRDRYRAAGAPVTWNLRPSPGPAQAMLQRGIDAGVLFDSPASEKCLDGTGPAW